MVTTGRVELRRAKAARARRRRPLGLEAIVDVALHIVDTEGVDAVSMRRVAAEFDTGPASLYAYVASKDTLLQLVLDRVVDEVPVPDGDTWQDVVRRYAHDTRAVMVRHNDAARLSLGVVPRGERTYEVADRVLEAMARAGVPPQVAAWALDVLALYVAADAYEGWLMGERFRDDSGRTPQEVGMEYFQGVAEDYRAQSAERYPSLAAHVSYLVHGDGEARFAFGVDMLIAGFEAQIPEETR